MKRYTSRASTAPKESGSNKSWLLTPRQLEVMEIVATGGRNVDIADALKISARTVNNHLNQIYRTLGVNNRIAALRVLQQIGESQGRSKP